MSSFTLIGRNPKEEFEKVGFRVFAILRKKIIGGNGHGQWQSDSGLFRESDDIRFFNVRHTVWELKAKTR